jgi:predicted O-methyltransferase YrrM
MRTTLKQLASAKGLTPHEACLELAELARVVPPDQVIVEIGVYMARSTVYLAYGAQTGNKAHVYGIDPWDLPGDRGPYGADPTGTQPHRVQFTATRTLQAARREVRRHGMRDDITLYREFSADVAARWEPRPKIGLLYVDGDHRYDFVRGDLEAWAPNLAPDAMIVFDDYADTHPEVIQAVQDMVSDGLLEPVSVRHGRLAVTKLAGPVGATPKPDGRTDTEREADEQAAISRGEVVESDTAGTGEAVNADTGEVTPAGQPLPEIEQTDGEPLPPPEPEEQLPEPPPRAGAGSSAEAWREYAHRVADIDATVLAGMNRQEIIDRLKADNLLDG